MFLMGEKVRGEKISSWNHVVAREQDDVFASMWDCPITRFTCAGLCRVGYYP
jgi:hypothetical protein